MADIFITFKLATGLVLPANVKLFAKLVGDTSGIGRVRINFSANPQRIGALPDTFTQVTFNIFGTWKNGTSILDDEIVHSKRTQFNMDRQTYENYYSSVTISQVQPISAPVAGTGTRVSSSSLIIQSGVPQPVRTNAKPKAVKKSAPATKVSKTKDEKQLKSDKVVSKKETKSTKSTKSK